MRYIGITAAILLFIGSPLSSSALASAKPVDDAPDLGAQTRAIFASKCSQCHDSNLSKPKGKFGYVLDLPRLAASPKLLTPGKPAQSKLWREIASGDMPPEDARAGGLSDGDKALVRWWIEAGAPTPRSDMKSTAGGVIDANGHAHKGIIDRLMQWIGRFHVLVIHFPIALLAAAVLGEAFWFWRGRFGISPAVRYCVLIGAAGAIAAASLGWLRAPYTGYDRQILGTLFLHRWLGTGAAILSVIAVIASERDVMQGRRTKEFQIVLLASAMLIGLAAHLGGTLVYGADFFNW